MQEPYKVSLLIPVYGVENQIERCAISLFEQSYQNIEYVFVDDNTKDRSITILREAMRRYPHRHNAIKLVRHQVNKGIAATRNTLIEEATGEFLIFVDSDDWIEPFMVENCVKEQMSSQAEIVSTDYLIHYSYGTEYKQTIRCWDTSEVLRQSLQKSIEQHVWGRLIKVSLFKDNHIRLLEGCNFAEDVVAMSFLFYYAQKHSVVPKALYNYEDRNDTSYTKTFSYRSSEQSLENLHYVTKFLIEKDAVFESIVSIAELRMIALHMYRCSQCPSNRNYYDSVLLPLLSKHKHTEWIQVPLKYRVILFLHNFKIVGAYSKTTKCLKRIYENLLS